MQEGTWAPSVGSRRLRSYILIRRNRRREECNDLAGTPGGFIEQRTTDWQGYAQEVGNGNRARMVQASVYPRAA